MLVAIGVLALGAGLVGWGITGLRRDPRRLRPSIAILAGSFVVVIGLASVLSTSRWAPGALGAVLVTLGVVAALAYPVLTGFLLVNGVTMIRRERASPAHLLSLALGIAMALLPALGVLAVRLPSARTGSGALWGWLSLVIGSAMAYLAFVFGAFLLGTFLYRRVGRRFPARYIVVLGAGLRGRRVSPVLAKRLDRAAVEFRRQGGAAILVPSGGRGEDEVRTEASAMSEYLRTEHGIPAEQIVPEDRARTTRENLLLSQALFAEPDARAIVVTSGYHVLRAAVLTRELRMRARVVGCRTAGYYLPSAYLREFAALLVSNRMVNLLAAGAFIAATMVFAAVLR